MSHPRSAHATPRADASRLVRRVVLATAALIGLAGSAGAQVAPGRVTGTVIDSASGRPLSSVQVMVVGTRYGASTNDAGQYVIAGVPAGTYAVEGRRVGYRIGRAAGVAITSGASATVDLRMATVPLSLEAVVTTGVVDPTSGTRVPFTVGRVSAEDMPVPSTNAVESIQGKVAGVTVIPSGQPGSGTSIMLRSPTSINKSNAPLVVVDGVVQTDAFGGASADLQSLDIESVEIVKGAAAASLYGSRAAAGVVQIRTRRGANLAEGTTSISLRTEVGNSEIANPIGWATQHYYRTNEAGQYVNAAGTVVPRAQRVAKLVHERFQDSRYADPIYDQVDRFFDPGQFYKNSITFAQNAGRTNWLLSLVNGREDGVVLNSGQFNQNDVRLNLDHQLRPNLSFSFSGFHSRTNRQELYGDTFFDLINQAPDVDLRQPDPDGTPYIFQPDPEGREENPLYVLSTEENNRRRARTQGNIEARYSALSWLTFDANLGYDRSDRRVNFFLDQGVKTEGFGSGGPGEISQTTGTTNAINAAASANLLGTMGPLTLRSTVRAILEREDNEVTTARGETFATPGVRSLNNATVRFVSSSVQDVRSNGYFVTAGADYLGRYIADGLVRRDGSSLFGPEEVWNTYYRVSGAWRLAEESWWPSEAINEFKLRASQGTAGGRPSFADQYETFSFLTGGGVQKATLGNRFLKPEHATETEVGVDMIVQNRYSLQLSYAKSRVVDQLLQIPLAGFFGYTSQWRNAGTVEGNTLEGTFEAQVLQRPRFTWRMGLVADRSRNRITEFNSSCFTRDVIAYLCEGETLGSMYGFRFIKGAGELPGDVGTRANEFQVNDEGLLVWVGPGNAYTEGQTKSLWGSSTTIGGNVYGWGMPITLKEGTAPLVVPIGQSNPDFHVGLTNNVAWRNFGLYTLLDAQKGGQVYNRINQRMYQYGRSADVDQAGKQQELKKPVEYYVSLYAANDPTDYFVEDAGFVKLREVALRYRFGDRMLAPLARFGARGVTAAVIGRNLFTWTPYGGYDPEVNGASRPTTVRLDSFDYPRYRTITGSIQLDF
ncbi:MAG: SusC/RagA family TonB-linked outer membrane protein [Gemmatimonadaceae bacterium]|nr:SusC/RagA family TonB-linked outer membrane protein [Gemmatimonadaceae bacterium]